MKLKLSLLIFILTNTLLFSQVQTNSNNIFYAKEFSKEVALYNSKNFLFEKLLGSTEQIEKFEIIPLAAASSEN